MADYHDFSKAEIFKEFDTSEAGLTSRQASEHLLKYGSNKLTQKKKKPAFVRFLEQFKDFMILILLAAAIVVAVMGLVQHEYEELIDAGIILVIVLMNAIINFIQQNKADSALESLRKLNQPYAKVLRDGELVNIPTENLVAGDKVLLEAGDVVPADLYIIEARSLQLNESALTGESVSVDKKEAEKLGARVALGDRHNIAHSSSVVTYGRGAGIVVATGMKTEVGKIAKALEEVEDEKTPIQDKLDRVSKVIGIAVLAVAAIIFVLNVVVKEDSSIFDSLLVAIAIAVAAIPESLPAVVTIIMALSVSRMSKQNAIIRKMSAVETLGSCEIICSDKTGTLTQNRMQVREIYWENKVYNVTENPAEIIGKADELIRSMQLCTDSIIADGQVYGDPTENALVAYALKIGKSKTDTEKEYPRVAELPFDSNRKCMTTYHKVGNNIIGYTKGSPDILLDYCTHYYKNGKTVPITPDFAESIKQEIVKANSKALRTLAFARRVHENVREFSFADEQGLTFMGFVGMMDPPREEVKAAVATCKSAGMTPIMITGDHLVTAVAIAKMIGLAESESQAVTGRQLDAMSDKEFLERIQNIRVYARVSPENKVRIVDTWKKLGRVVAMTGDGVNDAPSIKRADIGVGMGISGTELTKQVSDIVLADDNFATIVLAVKEGRRIYDNIKKTIHYLFGTNLTEVLTLLAVTLATPKLTFLYPLQILFINLATDGLPAIALGMEEAEKDIMQHKPRRKSAGLFSEGLGTAIISEALMQTAIVLTIFYVAFVNWGNAIATTMAFLTLSFLQLVHVWNVRTHKSVFRVNPFRDKLMWLAVGVGFALNLFVALTPPVAEVFGLAQLNWMQWLIVAASALAIIPLVEIYKLVERVVFKYREKNPKAPKAEKQRSKKARISK